MGMYRTKKVESAKLGRAKLHARSDVDVSQGHGREVYLSTKVVGEKGEILQGHCIEIKMTNKNFGRHQNSSGLGRPGLLNGTKYSS